MNNRIHHPLINWIEESVMVKLVVIVFLSIILLIPSSMIQSLVSERQQRQNEVITDITTKWADEQTLEGPVLVLPYLNISTQKDINGKSYIKEAINHIYILPEVLNIKSTINPEIRQRGIYSAVVYENKVQVDGKFSELELIKSGINPNQIIWNKAKLVIGLSDLKGLKNNPNITFDNKNYTVEPDFSSLKLFKNNLVIAPDLSSIKKTNLSFKFNLQHRGSNSLNFSHLGKFTQVSVKSTWTNPSFTGNYLPDNSQITKTGFSANWRLPHFNRAFPQQWLESNATIETKRNNSLLGVKFLLPVDQYQKTTRTIKYAFLIILLTFVSLLFTELIHKKQVHLLHYVLIGAAMTIYYTLLLGFSEHIGFNWAYIIASVTTVLLISYFISAIVANKKLALIFGLVLSVFYLFIFIIIQLQDYALLFGSIGLFVTIAVLMKLTATYTWKENNINE